MMSRLGRQRLTLSLFGFYLVALAVSFPLQGTRAREPPVRTGIHPANSNVSGESTSRGLQVLQESNAIESFLTDREEALDNFHVHGWRWHTLSLSREAGRLSNLAKKTSISSVDTLQKATDYVVGFNLKGLHKIEADLFFPWMRQKLTSIDSQDAAKEFGQVMDLLETDRRRVAELGDSITKAVKIASDTNQDENARKQAIETVANDSAALKFFTEEMITLEDGILVPAISQTVSESEQQSFNNKVLRNLGLFDSRLHLVGMYEAIWETDNSREKSLFQKAMPSIPQMMIPRWKRKLYDPKTDCLEL